uniref:indole-3-glycerol-phosphate synthase n=2 Tax=Babesia bovis TaxID=5865 RepID=A7AU26_BABBO|eukprot:XP_001610005.1 hypothetical protein [Babesia bovis T2Bo]
MIMDKYAQVDQLLASHSDPNDPLQLRLNFVECTSNHKLGEMLRKHSDSKKHALSVIADMKRRTPTHHPKCDNSVLSYVHAPEVAKNMAEVGFDVVFINTDETVYGGHVSEIYECFLELRKLGRRIRPAIVMKDIILHPIQVAQAAELRADGVLLNGPLLGYTLKSMLEACENMGIEAIVEVHTGADALKAVDAGAQHLMVNQWDRVSNQLRPTRALELREVVGDKITLIAAGGLINIQQIHELGLIGYDAVVLGRRLMYQDIPELVQQIKSWKAPCKSILRMSKTLFFDFDYTPENGLRSIKLKPDHTTLLNEMNAFYNNGDVDMAELLKSVNNVTDNNIEQLNSETGEQYLEKLIKENDKVVTITYGNPVNTCYVKNILSTVESPDCMIDYDEELRKMRLSREERRLFVECEKWVDRNRHLYKTRDDAYDAYALNNALEMYNKYLKLDIERALQMHSKEYIEEVGITLRENLEAAYKHAPRDEQGKVILPKEMT